jgi:hypothetical protein
MLNFFIGAIVMYVALYIVGRYIRNKANNLALTATFRYVENDKLMFNKYTTVEDAFYCLFQFIQDGKGDDKILRYQLEPIQDSKDNSRMAR